MFLISQKDFLLFFSMHLQNFSVSKSFKMGSDLLFVQIREGCTTQLNNFLMFPRTNRWLLLEILTGTEKLLR